MLPSEQLELQLVAFPCSAKSLAGLDAWDVQGVGLSRGGVASSSVSNMSKEWGLRNTLKNLILMTLLMP